MYLAAVLFIVAWASTESLSVRTAPQIKTLATKNVNLPGFEGENVVAAAVLADNVGCIVERKSVEKQERPDDEWEKLVFTFVNTADGSKISDVAPVAKELKGKAENLNDEFFQVFTLDDNTALLTVAVTEGHYDEEMFSLHGYAISGKGKLRVVRVFRENYDGANMIASAAVGLLNDVYVIASPEGEVNRYVNKYDVSILDGVTQTQLKYLWPDDSVRYPIVGSFGSYLVALEQINKKDKPITQALALNLQSGRRIWHPIKADPQSGAPKVTWTAANGKFAQAQDSLFSLDQGTIWKMSLFGIKDEHSFTWQSLGRVELGESGKTFLTTGTWDSKLFILVKGGDGLKLVSVQ